MTGSSMIGFCSSVVWIFTVEENGNLVDKGMNPGDEYHIRPGIKHRMEAVKDCHVFEVSTTQLDDVVRLEDAYGRAPAGPSEKNAFRGALQPA